MKIINRANVFLLLALTLGLTSGSLWAVEDGLGTNVVRNMRVKTNGVIDLGGTAITNWNQVGSTADVAALQGATNALNYQVTNVLYGATNVINTSVTTVSYQVTNILYGATSVLNSATGALNIAVGVAQATATYGSNTANWASNTAYYGSNMANWASNTAVYASNTVNTKLDRLNGTATNLTVVGKFVQAVAISTQVVETAGYSIPVNDIFIPVMSTNTVADVTASLAGGTAAGQIIILQGQDNSHTVTLTNNPNLVILCDGVNFTFKSNNTMQLIWNNGKWVELNRVEP